MESKEIADILEKLVRDRKETVMSLSKLTMLELKRKYFPGAFPTTIYLGLKEYRERRRKQWEGKWENN